jgi:glycerol-3-phosphate O-acyltransferase
MAAKKPFSEPVAPDLAILGDAVTIHPSGITESSEAMRKRVNKDHSRELVSTMARFRKNPLEWMREVSLHVNGTGWRAYDNFVGQPEYFPGFTEKMKTRVLTSPMLQAKIAELANQRAKLEATEGTLPVKRGHTMSKEERRVELDASLKDVADKMVDAMICKMESKAFIKSAYYLVTQLLTRAYHQGIHVSSEEVIRLRAVAEEAAKKKQSIIFLPSHRSHVDYVSLQILSFRLNLALPTVVAGDNLNFPVVGPFLQSAGAMWIRRSFGNDQLYSTVVQAYIDTLLQQGYNLECFIEGGRSRTGKLLPPKFGILGFVLDSLISGRVEDAIVCPVSTQYDKVIEVDSYITELLGKPKQKESLAGFMSASSILNLNLGRIDVRFHEPWSLRAYMNEQFTKFTKLPPQMSNQDNWTTELRTRLLRVWGYKVLSEINDVSVIMPTALIGTIILTLRGRGVGKTELIRRVDWLCDRVHAKGGRVAHFANLPTEIVVERGLEVLGSNLVGRITNLPEDTFYAVDR